MPIYEYVCIKCDHSFEELLSFHESDLDLPCPECQYTAVRQVSQTSPPKFKGPGFHCNDYNKREGQG